jgi:uncharacterized repeat protein (TIGR01451 family)
MDGNRRKNLKHSSGLSDPENAVTNKKGETIMRTRINLLAIFIVTTMVLLSTSPVWALGTADDQTISNQASVEFTINGTTTTTTSNTETFEVDTKVRPIVTNDGGNNVVAGVTDFSMAFTVTNEGNSAAGSEYFNLSDEVTAQNNFTMGNVRIYNDVNGNGTYESATDTLVAGPVQISNVSGSNSAQFLIVGDTPASNGAGDATDTGVGGNTVTYSLVATASEADGTPLVADGDGNDPTLHEIVFTDDAGTAVGPPADIANDGFHSDSGVFTTLATLGVAKTASDGTSGYHIPGDTVTYDIDVTNGDLIFPATSVVVTDSIPAQTTYVQITSCNGTSNWSTDNQTSWVAVEPAPAAVTDIRCTIATIASGTTETVSFEVSIQ